jgi:acetyltransferase-like isoleucine patch superfamily enzyme
VQLKDVCIGDGTWLGENVCVIGCSIGRHCVIGANSVVTRDIPDHCVVVGSPARIVKRYSAEQRRWLRTDPDGELSA